MYVCYVHFQRVNVWISKRGRTAKRIVLLFCYYYYYCVLCVLYCDCYIYLLYSSSSKSPAFAAGEAGTIAVQWASKQKASNPYRCVMFGNFVLIKWQLASYLNLVIMSFMLSVAIYIRTVDSTNLLMKGRKRKSYSSKNIKRGYLHEHPVTA